MEIEPITEQQVTETVDTPTIQGVQDVSITETETDFEQPKLEQQPIEEVEEVSIEPEPVSITSDLSSGFFDDDGKKKIKKTLVEAYYSKRSKNLDYNYDQAVADFPELAGNYDLVRSLEKYTNTRNQNKYTDQELNDMFSSKFGYEISDQVEPTPPAEVGKVGPGESTAGISGVSKSQSSTKEPSKNVEKITITGLENIGDAKQVSRELNKALRELNARDLDAEIKPGKLPVGWVVNQNGTVKVSAESARELRMYQDAQKLKKEELR
jgi:hypothetical protein